MRLLDAAIGRLRRVPRAQGALLAAGWCALIFLLGGRTTADFGPQFALRGWLVNLLHAPEYGLLALWLLLALPRVAGLLGATGGRAWAVWAACVAVGLLDEWHQSGVAGRDASLADVGTDAAGAWLALALLAAQERGGSAARVARAAALPLACCLLAAAIATLVSRLPPGAAWP